MMKIITLLLLTITLTANCLATDLPRLPEKHDAQMVTVGFVEIDGQRYTKIMSPERIKAFSPVTTKQLLASQPGLFSGDMIKQGKLSNIERISGNLLISTENKTAMASIAQLHQLAITYTLNNMAILKAPKGQELTSLLKALKADKRIKVVNLERIVNKMHPE